jgi:hypothetical protein
MRQLSEFQVPQCVVYYLHLLYLQLHQKFDRELLLILQPVSELILLKGPNSYYTYRQVQHVKKNRLCKIKHVKKYPSCKAYVCFLRLFHNTLLVSV